MTSLTFRTLFGSLLTVTAYSLVAAAPAISAPHVYSNFVTGIDTLDECLSRARRTARSIGFTSDVQVVNLKGGKGAEFFADHASFPMAVNVHCVPSTGTVSIGIAGMNNDRTYNTMRQFYDAF